MKSGVTFDSGGGVGRAVWHVLLRMHGQALSVSPGVEKARAFFCVSASAPHELPIAEG